MWTLPAFIYYNLTNASSYIEQHVPYGPHAGCVDGFVPLNETTCYKDVIEKALVSCPAGVKRLRNGSCLVYGEEACDIKKCPPRFTLNKDICERVTYFTAQPVCPHNYRLNLPYGCSTVKDFPPRCVDSGFDLLPNASLCVHQVPKVKGLCPLDAVIWGEDCATLVPAPYKLVCERETQTFVHGKCVETVNLKPKCPAGTIALDAQPLQEYPQLENGEIVIYRDILCQQEVSKVPTCNADEVLVEIPIPPDPLTSQSNTRRTICRKIVQEKPNITCPDGATQISDTQCAIISKTKPFGECPTESATIDYNETVAQRSEQNPCLITYKRFPTWVCPKDYTFNRELNLCIPPPVQDDITTTTTPTPSLSDALLSLDSNNTVRNTDGQGDADPEIVVAAAGRAKIAEPEVGRPEVAQPAVSQPAVSQPEIAQPAVSQPEIAQPAVSQPEFAPPAVSQPKTAQPVVSQSEIAQPEIAQPEIAQPATSQLEIAPPAVSKREIAQPAVSQPEIAQPAASQPKIAQPAVSQPEIAQPAVSQPEIAQPAVSQPEIAHPAASQPEIAQPAVSQPEIALPAVSQPEIAQPAVSQPEIAQAEGTNPTESLTDEIINDIPPAQETVFDTNVINEIRDYERRLQNIQGSSEPPVPPVFKCPAGSSADNSLDMICWETRYTAGRLFCPTDTGGTLINGTCISQKDAPAEPHCENGTVLSPTLNSCTRTVERPADFKCPGPSTPTEDGHGNKDVLTPSHINSTMCDKLVIRRLPAAVEKVSDPITNCTGFWHGDHQCVTLHWQSRPAACPAGTYPFIIDNGTGLPLENARDSNAKHVLMKTTKGTAKQFTAIQDIGSNLPAVIAAAVSTTTPPDDKWGCFQIELPYLEPSRMVTVPVTWQCPANTTQHSPSQPVCEDIQKMPPTEVCNRLREEHPGVSSCKEGFELISQNLCRKRFLLNRTNECPPATTRIYLADGSRRCISSRAPPVS